MRLLYYFILWLGCVPAMMFFIDIQDDVFGNALPWSVKDKSYVGVNIEFNNAQDVEDQKYMQFALRSSVNLEPDDVFRQMPPVIDPAGPFCMNDNPVNLVAIPPGGTWSGPGITNSSTGTFDPAVAGEGTHIISYTDPGGEMAMIDIQVYPTPIVSFISGDGLNCFGDEDGDISITITGGTPIPGFYPYIFDWDWDQTPENDDYSCGCGSIEHQNLNNLAAGIYFVTVTDANGCTVTAWAEVSQPASDMSLSASVVHLECYGDTDGAIQLFVSGGTPHPITGVYMYTWQWNQVPFTNYSNPTNLTGLAGGVYSVTVTDFAQCSATLDITIDEPSELIATATADHVECAGESTGSIQLTVSGGTPSYFFDWDYDGPGGNNPQNPVNLPAGIHTVTVTDANGCSTTTSVEIQEPAASVSASATAGDVTCFGAMDGAITLSVSGGTGSYTFIWNFSGAGNTSQNPSGLSPGSYTVTVTDANGCTTTASASLTEPDELTGVLDTTICAGGFIVINGTTYNGGNTNGVEVFVASNGCDSTVTVTVGFDPPLMGEENYNGCIGDGYSVIVGGTVYNENNPTGSETLSTADGCDSIVTVTLTFVENTTGEVTYTGCEGDGYQVIVGGMLFDENSPTGEVTLVGSNGCDSVVTINLVFNQETQFELTNDGCEGDGFSVVINGTTYDQDNPGGVEIITNSSGCDSIITINLFFGENSDGDEIHTSCSGSGFSITVNGTVYNESNPSGTETLVNGIGCDSVVTIELTFLPLSQGQELHNGCTGDGYEVVVNGNVYNESNPSGVETLTGSNGCDSIVTISLIFEDLPERDELYSGCEGDGYEINIGGSIFNESNPSGMVIIPGTSGCDTLVTVDLVFYAHTEFALNYQGCEGDGFSVNINGVTYDENNTSGVETISNSAGCDSVITINLVFSETSEGEELHTSCTGSGFFIIVNGTVYNENNPTGTEIFVNPQGCDSVVTIELTYLPVTQSSEFYNGCTGDGYYVIVNGTIYDESNPAGTETLTGSNGCDSVVTIALVFSEMLEREENYTGCEADGYEIVVGGITFNENNPSGSVIIPGIVGCDTLVVVDLTFNAHTEYDLQYQGCEGDGFSVTINGVNYNENNPFGTETITNMAGCDSLITIELYFNAISDEFISYSGCQGDGYFVVVNGIVYDATNPSGVEIMTNVYGCDSTITIDLVFSLPSNGLETYNGCSGDGYFVIVNGVIYDESNPAGTEYLLGADGCDSIVLIDLHYSMEIVTYLNPMLCSGGYIIVGNTLYNESNPTGTEYFLAQGGCDSIVHVDLMFNPPLTGLETYDGCLGDGYFVVVNGTVYDEFLPSGTEVFQNAEGCDTVVTIDLMFSPAGYVEIFYQGCAGDGYTITVNGTIYDESNPAGEEQIETSSGCDSLVIIDLTFNPDYFNTITHFGCIGDNFEIFINGVIYNEANPSGTEIMQSINGCDSIVIIDLHFDDDIEIYFNPEVCTGGSLLFDGTLYDASNPSGTHAYVADGGCDSLVHVELVFLPVPEGILSYSGCMHDGYFVEVNGTIYNQNNPSGTEHFSSPEGCDTIVQIDLVFAPSHSTSIDTSLCEGDSYSVTINGTLYNESNPAGIEELTNVFGCDSTIYINLSFENCCSTESVIVARSICLGQSVSFHGGEFDSTGIYTIVIADAAGPGCDSIYILDLTVADVIVFQMQEGICEGELFEFNGQFYSQSGVYADTLTGGAAHGCDSITVLILTVHSSPIADAGQDKMITCADLYVILDGSAQGGGIFWTGPGITPQNQSQPNPQVNRPGVYTLTVTSAEGCIAIDQVVVDRSDDTPVVDAGPDQSLSCKANSVQLTAEIIGQNLVWFWQGSGIHSGNMHQTSPSVSEAGMYILYATDTVSMCEAVPDTVFVTNITNQVTAIVSNPQEMTCTIEFILLDGSGSIPANNVVYVWQDPQGDTISTEPAVLVLNPGMYLFVVLDTLSGCYDSARVEVQNIVEYPSIDAGEDQFLSCMVDVATVEGSIFGPSSNVIFSWSGPAGGIISDAAQLAVQVGLPGWYFLTAIDTINGCETIDSMLVEDLAEIPIAQAQTTGDLNCHRAATELNSTGSTAGAGVLYIWNGPGISNITSASVQISGPGTFTLTVIDTVSGCSDEDTVQVFLTPSPEALVDVVHEECIGDHSGAILISHVEGGTGPYSYALNGGMFQSNTEFQGLGPGAYIVELIDSDGCGWSREVVVIQGLDLQLDIGQDIRVQRGRTIQLNSQINVSWSTIDSIVWTPAHLLSCTHCPDPWVTVLSQAAISAIIYAGACSDTASILLDVDQLPKVYIPNVFTPNNDGINDHFTVFGDSNLKQIRSLEVFDRWGEKVFLRSEFAPGIPELGWDGLFHGRELQPGVFVYRAVLEFINDDVRVYAGDVTLLR